MNVIKILNSMFNLIHVCVCVHQGSSGVTQPAGFAVAVQCGLLLLAEALGPGVCLQRRDVCLAMLGRLPDLHWQWQGHGETLTEVV